VSLTILHTNDQHGRFAAFNMIGQTDVGGMACRKTFVDEVRQEVQQQGGRVLILDTGDVNTGEPSSDALIARPDIELMNLLGYEAMALGNHEFDLKLEKLQLQQSWAKFPYLCANVFYSSTKERIFEPYKIIEYNGLRIGILSVITHHTPLLSTNGKDPRLLFEDPEVIIPKILVELKPKCDFIIALMHLDHDEAVRLAGLFPDIHLIIGGHTHLPMMQPTKVGETLVVEAGYYGLMMGRLDLQFQNKKLTSSQYKLVGMNLSKPICDEAGNVQCLPYFKMFEQNPDVVRRVKEYIGETEALFNQVIGEAATAIPRSVDWVPSSPLGNFISDAMKDYAKVDIAFQNVGGLRDDILQGPIRVKDLRRVLPFANTIAVFQITGEQILQILEVMAQNRVRNKGLLEVSGMTFVIQNQKIVQANVDGIPLDPKKIYKVATNSFIAGGGDGYALFAQWVREDAGDLLSAVVQAYIQKHSPLRANPEKRVIWQP